MSERTVVVSGVPEDKVDEMISRQKKDSFSLSSIAAGVPKFRTNNKYTTFSAEYTLQDGNIVIHFFLPEDFSGTYPRAYWERVFPAALDAVAQNVFQATSPRLQAKYTEELKSWWFRACKYDHVIDLEGFLTKFFDELDAALDTPPSESH